MLLLADLEARQLRDSGLKLLAIREDENAAEVARHPDHASQDRRVRGVRDSAGCDGVPVFGLSRVHRPADGVRVEYRTDDDCDGAARGHGDRAWSAAAAPSCFPSSMRCCGPTIRKYTSPRSGSSSCLPCCSRRGASINLGMKGGWLALGRPLFRRPGRNPPGPRVMTEPLSFASRTCRSGSPAALRWKTSASTSRAGR